jgi:hypothetical protein
MMGDGRTEADLPILVQGFRLLNGGATMIQRTNDHEAKAGCPAEHQEVGRLTAEQIGHVRKFIEQAGGVEQARAAIEALEKLPPAA